MKIVILRHGEAVFSSNDRVLTSRGMNEAMMTASKLSNITKISKCFCSPKTRAMQTCRIAARELGYKGDIEYLRELSPSGDPSFLVSYIESSCQNDDVILLVSHLPLVELLSYYINGKKEFPPSFDTACALMLDYENAKGRYERFISPYSEDRIF
ncbi:MAG: SixA phosphatase family protein [Succinivibrio sp.]